MFLLIYLSNIVLHIKVRQFFKYPLNVVLKNDIIFHFICIGSWKKQKQKGYSFMRHPEEKNRIQFFSHYLSILNFSGVYIKQEIELIFPDT